MTTSDAATPFWLLLLVAAVLALLALYFRPSARAQRRLRKLERQALSLIPGPRAQAQATLERHLSALREKYPEYNRFWHLRRFIAESKRAVR